MSESEKKKEYAKVASMPALPSLAPRDASVLSLLMQHPDAPAATRNRLIKSLSPSAQAFANAIRSGLSSNAKKIVHISTNPKSFHSGARQPKSGVAKKATLKYAKKK